MECLDGNPLELVCQAGGQAQVEPADRVWVGRSHLSERTGTQHELKTIAALPHLWLKPPPADGRAQLVGDRTSRVDRGHGDLGPGAATHVNGRLPGAEHLNKELAQALIWATGPPASVGGWMGFKDEWGTAGTIAVLGPLSDETGVDELRHVLANGVVVEPNGGGELRDPDRAAGINDEPEDLVAGRVTERLGLLLEWCGHASVETLGVECPGAGGVCPGAPAGETSLTQGREKTTRQVPSLG